MNRTLFAQLNPPSRIGPYGKRKRPRNSILLFFLLPLMVLCSTAAYTSALPNTLYTLNQAVALGSVDLYVHPQEPTSRKSSLLIADLSLINPGVVNRFGFQYGGPNIAFQTTVIQASASIRAQLPHALMGSAINEHLYTGVTSIICGGGQIKTFDVEFSKSGQPSMISFPYSNSNNLGWINPTNPDAYSYMLCLGQYFIDNDITMIHFENAGGVISANSDPTATLNAYKRLKSDITAYAKNLNKIVYFSATPELANPLSLDYTYTPMRVDTTAWPNYYINVVPHPGIGVGYSFTLSLAMIKDTKALVNNKTTKILFYIDNWEAGQDDLTALMELDNVNRRMMIKSSATIANNHGVYFVPSLNHCFGCIPPSYVVAKCELYSFTGSNGHPGVATEYDARLCGDLPAISQAIGDVLGPNSALSPVKKASVAAFEK